MSVRSVFKCLIGCVGFLCFVYALVFVVYDFFTGGYYLYGSSFRLNQIEKNYCISKFSNSRIDDVPVICLKHFK